MNLTVARKIGLLVVIALIGICIMAGLMWKQVGEVFDAANFANLNTVPSLREIDTAADAISDLRDELWQATSQTNMDQVKALEQQIAANQKKAIDGLAKYEKEDMDEPQTLFVPDKADLDASRANLAHYFDLKDQVLALVYANKASDARDLLVAKHEVSDKISPAFIAHRQLNMNFSAHASTEASATRGWALSLCAGVAMVTLASLTGAGYLIARSILVPLRNAVQAAETVSHGDLSLVIKIRGHDETSQLLRSLQHMSASLSELISRVRASSVTIATGSAQIAAGNTDLSQRTEEQAASLEETAASMEELTATVKQNAENAKQGNSLAQEASEIALRGGDVVGRVVVTMQQISESSAKVAEITTVIEGIAFQTNILALNAAVEAARAGEQGRGFAVVAGEVRILAQRSAAAAKEIKDLIAQSLGCVSLGSQQVDEAGRTMTEVVQSVRRVTNLMGEITSASGEQHTGIEQVNKAVSQMDAVTQRNAALVEEASAAAQSMATQSSALIDLVSTFKLGRGELTMAA